MSKILALTSTRITATEAMGHGPALPAAAIHGFWTMKMMPLAPETVIGNIAAIADRASAKPSTQPATAIPMEAGRNIPAASTVGKAIAEIAVHPAMTMLRTA